MELLTRIVIVVWCSTVVHYTFAKRDSIKKTCLNKKCIKTSNPFEITEIDPTAMETRSAKVAEKSGYLFNEEVNQANVKKITEVFDNGFYSALCWIEITTITEFKNGSNNAIREYAISFESPSDIPKSYLFKEDEGTLEVVPYKIFDQETKKSEVINFTTTKTSGDVTVRQNRKILCGSGPIYTKEYFEWLNSSKKKIELRVSPKKQNLVASECKDDQNKSDGGNTESDVTVRHENLNNIIQQEKAISKFQVTSAKDLNSSSSFSTSTVSSTQKVDEDLYKVTTQTKLLPNNETTSITVRLGSENFKFTGESTSENNIYVSPNLSKHDDIGEEIVFKIKSGVTDSPVSTLSPSQAENYSINSEKFITSTEETSFNDEEYSSFATSRKLTAKPQLDVAITKGFDVFSFGSTKNDYNYEEKSTPNLHPLTFGEKLPEGTALDVETSRSDHTMYIKPKHPKESTTDSIVTKFDNSKDTQSTEFNQNPSTLSSEITVSSTTVPKVPILNKSSPKLENVNTLKPPESENFNTEKSWSTLSIEKIPETTVEEAHVTTSLSENITVSNTDNPITVTETPKAWNIELSTVKYDQKNDSTNATVPNQFSIIENYQQLHIPLNETMEKISVRVNVLTDHISEGINNGKFFRNITPLIGVEKKIEFNLKFKNQALETYKKELGYNWDKFMENLILNFFGNRTNDLNNIKIGGCKNNVVDTGENHVKNPTPELLNNKLNVVNSGTGFLTSHQQINNQHLLFQNQQKPAAFNKYKEKFDSIHTFTYPPIGNLVTYSQNSAILFKNKQPVFRLPNWMKAKNATGDFVNYSLPLASTFSSLRKAPMSVMLQKVLNLTKIVPVANFSESIKNGSSSHHSDSTTNFNMDESTKNDIGNRVNSSLPLASEKVADEDPEFRFMDPTKYIFHKLKNFQKLVFPTTQNQKTVEVEEKNEENTKPHFVQTNF